MSICLPLIHSLFQEPYQIDYSIHRRDSIWEGLEVSNSERRAKVVHEIHIFDVTLVHSIDEEVGLVSNTKVRKVSISIFDDCEIVLSIEPTGNVYPNNEVGLEELALKGIQFDETDWIGRVLIYWIGFDENLMIEFYPDDKSGMIDASEGVEIEDEEGWYQLHCTSLAEKTEGMNIENVKTKKVVRCAIIFLLRMRNAEKGS